MLKKLLFTSLCAASPFFYSTNAADTVLESQLKVEGPEVAIITQPANVSLIQKSLPTPVARTQSEIDKIIGGFRESSPTNPYASTNLVTNPSYGSHFHVMTKTYPYESITLVEIMKKPMFELIKQDYTFNERLAQIWEERSVHNFANTFSSTSEEMVSRNLWGRDIETFNERMSDKMQDTLERTVKQTAMKAFGDPIMEKVVDKIKDWKETIFTQAIKDSVYTLGTPERNEIITPLNQDELGVMSYDKPKWEGPLRVNAKIFNRHPYLLAKMGDNGRLKLSDQGVEYSFVKEINHDWWMTTSAKFDHFDTERISMGAGVYGKFGHKHPVSLSFTITAHSSMDYIPAPFIMLTGSW